MNPDSITFLTGGGLVDWALTQIGYALLSAMVLGWAIFMVLLRRDTKRRRAGARSKP